MLKNFFHALILGGFAIFSFSPQSTLAVFKTSDASTAPGLPTPSQETPSLEERLARAGFPHVLSAQLTPCSSTPVVRTTETFMRSASEHLPGSNANANFSSRISSGFSFMVSKTKTFLNTMHMPLIASTDAPSHISSTSNISNISRGSTSSSGTLKPSILSLSGSGLPGQASEQGNSGSISSQAQLQDLGAQLPAGNPLNPCGQISRVGSFSSWETAHSNPNLALCDPVPLAPTDVEFTFNTQKPALNTHLQASTPTIKVAVAHRFVPKSLHGLADKLGAASWEASSPRALCKKLLEITRSYESHDLDSVESKLKVFAEVTKVGDRMHKELNETNRKLMLMARISLFSITTQHRLLSNRLRKKKARLDLATAGFELFDSAWVRTLTQAQATQIRELQKKDITLASLFMYNPIPETVSR